MVLLNLCRDNTFFCSDRDFLLYNIYCRVINLIIETKFYCHFLIIVATEISAFTSSLCRNILFCITTFILQLFSCFVTIIDFFIATYFTSTLCCVCQDIKLLYRDKDVLTSIADSKFCVATELKNVSTRFHCHFP